MNKPTLSEASGTGSRHLILALLILLFAPVAQAEESNRAAHRFGAYMGILGDPFPTLVGANLGYHISDLARASIGLGSTFGAGVGFTGASAGIRLLIPGWDLTPSLGFFLGHSSKNYPPEQKFIGVNNPSQHFTYVPIGIEWQAPSGLNLGASYNILLNGGGSAPSVQIGWYFDCTATKSDP